jgi:hypothetical protein
MGIRTRSEQKMTTYTLALLPDLLLATCPDGDNIEHAVNIEMHKIQVPTMVYETVSGCTLTDEEPEDQSHIVWRSGDAGYIYDETGRIWVWATKPYFDRFP